MTHIQDVDPSRCDHPIEEQIILNNQTVCTYCGEVTGVVEKEDSVMIEGIAHYNSTSYRSLIPKTLIAVAIILLGVFSFPSDVEAFNSPSGGDPWYYQTDKAGLMFIVPDKIQHYWGSYGLNEIASQRFGRFGGALTAFALGFAWEVRDTYKTIDPSSKVLVGFSIRDLIADGLGVLSSQLSTEKVQFYADYSTQDKNVMLNVAFSF